jgi:hypothetical protein
MDNSERQNFGLQETTQRFRTLLKRQSQGKCKRYQLEDFKDKHCVTGKAKQNKKKVNINWTQDC